MSVVGEKLAVVSLGSSCQSAHQIKQNAAMLSALAGDELTPKRFPFDWVICPVARTGEWIRSSDRFPQSPMELSPYKQDGTFHWKKQGMFFWHDFRQQKAVDVEGTFSLTRDKYDRFFNSFDDLRKRERVIFVVSNTQNNLVSVLGDDYQKGCFTFTPENTRAVKQSAEVALGKPCELLVVTYDERSVPALESLPEERMTIARIRPDDSEWKGDDATWSALFQRYFG
ncbi:MAG: hypothetical protein EPN45_21960 [Rhizobiaceae bacterium]|nr:MAG: hypothetical protein EPN45_21960 [Rhizobiaceae bacterium]